MMIFSHRVYRINKPKFTRSRKQQARQELAEEWKRQRTGLNIPVEQFCELQEGDPSLERYRKLGNCFKQNGFWYRTLTPKLYCGYSVKLLLLPGQC